jgi:predicted enzyme related to lactoylglutathione lyase
MARLDHMSLPVSDWRRARDWWRDVLGLKVEFEMPERSAVAMVDEADLTVFLENGEVIANPVLGFTIQVDDVEARHASLAAGGVAFVHPPMKVFWGYGAELLDPDGYRLYLWDETSMREKGGG